MQDLYSRCNNGIKFDTRSKQNNIWFYEVTSTSQCDGKPESDFLFNNILETNVTNNTIMYI